MRKKLKLKCYYILQQKTMSSLTFNERFNIERLKEIIRCNNYPIKPTGHREWRKVIRTDFEKYLTNAELNMESPRYINAK